MIPMLLVVGNLVPASDSPELTAPPQPSAGGATARPWDLVRPGMTEDEVKRLLGACFVGFLGVGGSDRWSTNGYRRGEFVVWVGFRNDKVVVVWIGFRNDKVDGVEQVRRTIRAAK
jgi:hypothetical protein